MVPVVGWLAHWNVVETSPGLFFGDVYLVRWIYNNFATLKNGYPILLEKKPVIRVFIWLFSALLALINQNCTINSSKGK